MSYAPAVEITGSARRTGYGKEAAAAWAASQASVQAIAELVAH